MFSASSKFRIFLIILAFALSIQIIIPWALGGGSATVNFAIAPSSQGGTIIFGGVNFGDGMETSALLGGYQISFVTNSGYTFLSWSTAGYVFVTGSLTDPKSTVVVMGPGTITANCILGGITITSFTSTVSATSTSATTITSISATTETIVSTIMSAAPLETQTNIPPVTANLWGAAGPVLASAILASNRKRKRQDP